MKKKRRRGKKGKSSRMGFWGRLTLWLNILVSLGLLSSWAATFIDPARFWPAAFIAMPFPALVIINLVFILIWLARLRPHFLISLLPILLGWGLVGAYFQIDLRRPHPPEALPSLKLASFNVRGFDKNDFYNRRVAETPRKILDWVYTNDPDIVFFQEFYSNAKRGFNMEDSCRAELGLPHVTRVKYLGNWRTIYMATMSKHPVISHGELRDEARRGFAIWTDIRLDEDTIRFINVHLQSIRLAEEIDILDNRLDPGLYRDPEFRRDAKSLLRKMKRAFVARSRQSNELARFIEASPYPVVIGGDLNDTPASYTYRTLSRKLRDGFRASGNGPANTYSGKLPSFRIDYLMHSEGIRAYQYKIHRIRASDHFPLTMELTLDPKRG